jgi:hypothetical protein
MAGFQLTLHGRIWVTPEATIGGLILGVTGDFALQKIESVWAGGISCLSDWQVSGFGVNRARRVRVRVR